MSNLQKHFWYILLFGLIIIWTYKGEAARPFGTDDAGTVEKGGFELEAGYNWGEEEGTLELGFKHGVTERMDIGIGFGYNVETEPENNLTAAEISLKFSIVPDILAASFTHEFGGSSYDLNAAFTKIFGPLEFDANLGYSVVDVDAGEGMITYGLALILATGEKIDVGTEILGNEDDLQSLLVGLRYKIREGLNLDVGFSQGIGEDVENTATFGLHYEF